LRYLSAIFFELDKSVAVLGVIEVAVYNSSDLFFD
jgi:hypothetical protein